MQRGVGVGHPPVSAKTLPPTESTPLLGPPPKGNGKAAIPKPTWAPERLSPLNSPARSRRSSGAGQRRVSRRPTQQHVGGSSDGQTVSDKGVGGANRQLFNAIAVLVGIGLLSMPLAFSYAGWIGGTVMLLGFSYITCGT